MTSQATYDYEAFISYSHAADGKLAPALETAIERFEGTWYRRSRVRVFRDETGLGLTPDLWGEIEGRLARTRCFVLLAAPEAARSPWVEKEIQYWLERRAGDPLLIVRTGGDLVWSQERGDFDWSRSDALPRSLQKLFRQEPLWADLSWAKDEAELTLAKPRFFVEVAKIVAGMRGLPLESVFDEAAARQRRATRWLWTAAAALVLVTVTAVAAALVGFQARGIAQELAQDKAAQQRAREELEEQGRRQVALGEQRKAAEAASVELAGKAAATLAQDRERSTLLALEALAKAPTMEAERALRQALLDGALPPRALRGHEEAVLGASFLPPDGARLLTTGADHTVRVWDAATGKDLRTFRVEESSGDVPFASASADGSKLLILQGPESFGTGYWESSAPIEVYDVATGKRLLSFRDKLAARADLSADGGRILIGGFNNSAGIYDATTGKLLFDLAGHDNRVTSAHFDAKGKRAVTTSYDGTARVWDAETGRSLAVLHAPKDLLYTYAIFSPDGEKVLTLGGENLEKDDHLEIWDWVHSPGGSLATFAGHTGAIQTVDFSPDGKLLATGSTDRTARLWDASTGKGLHVLAGFDDFLNGIAVSPDGRWVATASGDGTALVWDAVRGEKLTALGGDEHPRTVVSFSPDGKRIVVGTARGDVLLYSCEVLGSAEDLEALAKRKARPLP